MPNFAKNLEGASKKALSIAPVYNGPEPRRCQNRQRCVDYVNHGNIRQTADNFFQLSLQ